MTANYSDAQAYQTAVKLLSSSHLMDRFKASALEYAQWVVKNDPQSLHPKTHAVSDFWSNEKRFDYLMSDDPDYITFEDYYASRSFNFPLKWIISPDTLKEEFLAEVAEKTEVADREKEAKVKRIQDERYQRYLKLKEEFEGKDETND